MRTHTAITPLLLVCGLAHAGGPVIDIPPAALPSEAFFAANPDATVNVSGGEVIFPDAGDGTAFTFNGATVNLNSTSASGFFTLDHFIEDMTLNVNTGGELVRCKVGGPTGTTVLNIAGGVAERGLWLTDTTMGTMTSGDIGVVGGGQAAMIVEDFASFDMSGGTIDTFVIFKDDAELTQTGGSIDGPIHLEDRAVAIISGGSSGNNGIMRDPDCVLNIVGGTVGDAFVADRGTINMSSGGMGDNSALLNGTGGTDPVMNMTGGALGGSFRAYDGTVNISGGLVGDRFRCGRPTGDGSGVTCNLLVKSATLGGAPLTLSTTPTVITDRSGAFLSCVLMDDSLVGFTLNESSGTEDYFRSGAVLTIALGEEPCFADCDGNGSLNVDDIDCFVAGFLGGTLAAADCDGNGTLNVDDVDCFVAGFLAGCP